MKIAVPVEDKILTASISPSFGRAPYFLIYDTETKESEFLDNSAAASPGGAGIKAAQTIVDSRAKALLTPRCGENAAAVIKAADIKLYQTFSNSIDDNLQAFLDERLPLLQEIHPGFHGRGGE